MTQVDAPPRAPTVPKAPARPKPAPEPQPALPMDQPEAEAPLTPSDVVIALNFPTDANDTRGFLALKKAVQTPELAQLLQAAEDVLNALAECGVYTDDLTPAPATPTAWRAFAEGIRDARVAGVGGVTTEAPLAAVTAQWDGDEVFRDIADHFQRRFDVVLAEFCKTANDPELLALADTRTGRAFQILARVSGMVAAPA